MKFIFINYFLFFGHAEGVHQAENAFWFWTLFMCFIERLLAKPIEKGVRIWFGIYRICTVKPRVYYNLKLHFIYPSIQHTHRGGVSKWWNLGGIEYIYQMRSNIYGKKMIANGYGVDTFCGNWYWSSGKLTEIRTRLCLIVYPPRIHIRYTFYCTCIYIFLFLFLYRKWER